MGSGARAINWRPYWSSGPLDTYVSRVYCISSRLPEDQHRTCGSTPLMGGRPIRPKAAVITPSSAKS